MIVRYLMYDHHPRSPARTGCRRRTVGAAMGNPDAGASAVGIVSVHHRHGQVALLKDPTAGSFCDISSTVGCSPVLLAWQSSVLGPPNALLGVIMFAVPATAGAVVATGGRLVAGFHNAMLGLSVFFALFLTWVHVRGRIFGGLAVPLLHGVRRGGPHDNGGREPTGRCTRFGRSAAGAAGLAAGKWDDADRARLGCDHRGDAFRGNLAVEGVLDQPSRG